ncbi:hypothetical protein LOAG_07283 [Loa loa]|uniref:Uncharacterized protein n=1 Tax=Loa loa TaxID=7209 RepID=A0A1S0TWW6_LOALO|nr:hypothetical protein LOAG_07283 [Loa loa]EFO21207.1 hypothetical protein LOAG_07283 [Loa loa]
MTSIISTLKHPFLITTVSCENDIFSEFLKSSHLEDSIDNTENCGNPSDEIATRILFQSLPFALLKAVTINSLEHYQQPTSPFEIKKDIEQLKAEQNSTAAIIILVLEENRNNDKPYPLADRIEDGTRNCDIFDTSILNLDP